MKTHNLLDGVVHEIPTDLRKTLTADTAIVNVWNSLTPLARNEWICWVENAKLIDTRNRRIKRTGEELLEGVRRPCCWIGCIHRTDKAISPSIQGVLARRSKKSA
jgi:hypothetical protein